MEIPTSALKKLIERVTRRQRVRFFFSLFSLYYSRISRARCLFSLWAYGCWLGAEKPLQQDILEPLWYTVLIRDVGSNLRDLESEPTLQRIWEPLSVLEIKRSIPEEAIGLGGITSQQLRKIPSEILTRMCNVMLSCGNSPSKLLESRTVLIPKKANAVDPAQFRPIAGPTSKGIPRYRWLYWQRNVFRYGHQVSSDKSMFMAMIDMAKAFDSVSQEAICAILVVEGIPNGIIVYVMRTYMGSYTLKLQNS